MRAGRGDHHVRPGGQAAVLRMHDWWLGFCRQAYLVLAGVCVLVGATTTYGLAGDLRHAPPAHSLDNGGLDGAGWQFFQPFR